MRLEIDFLNRIIELRRQLHRFPELSGEEKETAKKLSGFINESGPDEIITGIGGYGFAAVYDSGKEGPTVLLRADLDALPIEESNTFEHKSTVTGVAHLCGHDGHSSILAGVSLLLGKNRPLKGRVILLFQPSEETGEGAERVITDEKYKKIIPDYAFAMHNLPGYNTGTICIKESSFASASTGMIVNLKGLPSHAAHPEDGNNPDIALANLILAMNEISRDAKLFKDFALITVIHAKVGERAFGTTPGNAVLMATLRTYLNDDMEIMKEKAEQVVKKICKDYDIKFSISYTEEFPATINNSECVGLIRSCAGSLNMAVHELKNPFRWSEDFGHFTKTGKAALFGIGSGSNHPQLHNEDYDFPDDIIEPAILIFDRILKEMKIIN